MKLYNISPKEMEFPWGKMSVVVLGERGRGRKQVLVPFHARFNENADNYEVGETQSGGVKIIQGQNSSVGYIAKLSGEGVYTRGTIGTVYVSQGDIEKIEVLEKGWGAYGDAGRIGTWYEYLVVIKSFPVVFYVRPAGGESKIPSYWLVFTAQKVYEVREEEAEIFAEQTGIAFPEKEELYDLYDARNAQVNKTPLTRTV
jgi:hypothetical protein